MGSTHHTPRTRAKVIAEFRRTGRVDLACSAAGCDRSDHYRWLKRFPKYAQDFDEAREQVAGLLEDEAVRRAYQGTMRPVTIAGQMAVVHEFSDRLLEFLLKCRNRAVFGDKQELTGKDGAPLHETREQADKSVEAFYASKRPNDAGRN